MPERERDQRRDAVLFGEIERVGDDVRSISATTTWAPSLAKRRAVAAPIPPEVPVMIAVLPSSRFMPRLPWPIFRSDRVSSQTAGNGPSISESLRLRSTCFTTSGAPFRISSPIINPAASNRIIVTFGQRSR